MTYQDSPCDIFPSVNQIDNTCKAEPVGRLALAKLIASLEGLETTLLD